MDKLLVIKIGGNVVDDEEKLTSLIRSFAGLNEKRILIHGGGKLATRLSNQLGIEQTMVEGRRITDAETLKIVTMVYAGLINKNIVARLQANQCDAIGLSGADGNTVLAHKRKSQAIDYGFAGDVDQVNAMFLHKLLTEDVVPVLSPITHDGNGQLLNTNADTIAQEAAKAMSSLYDVILIYLFEKPGVLLDAADDSSVIGIINQQIFNDLKDEKKVFEGMIPKLENAFSALQSGVKKVIIGKAEDLESLTQGKAGTAIVNE